MDPAVRRRGTCRVRSSTRAASGMRPLIGELTLNNFPDLPEDRRGAVPDGARPLAAHPGEHPEDAPRASWTCTRSTWSSRRCGSASDADGTWNLQGLLADPWPGPWLDKTPPILIENGTVELVYHEDSRDRRGRRGGRPARRPAARPGDRDDPPRRELRDRARSGACCTGSRARPRETPSIACGSAGRSTWTPGGSRWRAS